MNGKKRTIQNVTDSLNINDNSCSKYCSCIRSRINGKGRTEEDAAETGNM